MGDGNLLYVTFNWPEIMRKNIERLQDLTRDQNMKQVSQTGFSEHMLLCTRAIRTFERSGSFGRQFLSRRVPVGGQTDVQFKIVSTNQITRFSRR